MSNGLMDNIDLAAESAALLPSQYLTAPNVQGIVSAWSTGFQNLDDTMVAWQNGSLIDTAEGVNLDRLGARVGQYRTNESDTDYRRKIVARSLANRSCGTCENMLDVMTTLLGPNLLHVMAFDLYPAAFTLQLIVSSPLTTQERADVVTFMLLTKPSGVRCDGVAEVTDPVFAFDGYPSPPGAGYDVGAWADYFYP